MRLSLALSAAILLVGAGCSGTSDTTVPPELQTPVENTQPETTVEVQTSSTASIGEPKGTACTMDAKVCPDGSSVGRTGPNCEFAACPTTKPVEKPVEKPKEDPKPTGPATYTMAEVKAQAAAGKCWTVINAKVYDLSSWITQHPGGQAAIKSLCGIDGTAKFQAMHGGDARPQSTLSTFFVGNLK